MRNILLGKQSSIGTPYGILDSVLNSRHEFSWFTENVVIKGENFLKLKNPIKNSEKDEVYLV